MDLDGKSYSTLKNINSILGRDSHFTGVIIESNTLTSSERSIIRLHTLTTDIGKYECRNLRLILYSSPERVLTPGDIIEMSGVISIQNDTVPFSSYSEISYKSAKGPLLYSYLPSSTPTISGRSMTIMSLSYEICQDLCRFVDRTMLSTESKAVIKAIIFGNKSGLSYNQKRQFSDAGISHVLAVSGMHVGIICGILLFLTIPIQLIRDGFHFRYILCILFIWIYVLITGLSYSAVRAAIMVTFVMMSLISGRNRSSFSAACLSVALILICDPHSILSIGLWLSFACVSSIVLLVPKLNVVDISDHPKTHRICAFLWTTLVATAASWMISAYFFGTVAIDFFITNLLVLPLLPLYVIMAGCYLVISATIPLPLPIISILTDILDWPVRILFDLLERIQGHALDVDVSLESFILYYSGFSIILYTAGQRSGIAQQYISRQSVKLPYDVLPYIPNMKWIYNSIAFLLILTSIIIM
ncbi:MAG: ComEC/Rec2 family competence protein, partial [Muribaculaceae bacterium]|nr:ComEC/Rec2 family competence protein [Muribaculaceae bacterium]